MIDETSLFEEKDFEGDFYRWRNQKDQPKRIKFIAFCTFRPATDLNEYFHKRREEDHEYVMRDVEMQYLRQTIIKRFAQKPNPESHLTIFQNQKENELWKAMDKLKTDETLEYYDCYIFIFLSFISSECSETGETRIHFYDRKISIDKLWDKVGEISWMRGKPKLFIIQADDTRLMQEPQTIMKSGGFDVLQRKIPTEADRLTIMGTIPARYFVEGEKEPSFLIQAFVEELEKNMDYEPEPLDFMSLTTKINKRVAEMIKNSRVEKTKRQANDLPIPCATSTLRKLLII